MQRILDHVIFEGPVELLQIPFRRPTTFAPFVSTPNVFGNEFWMGSGVVYTITDFLFGAEGQRIHILGDNALIIANNNRIKTNTGSNKELKSNKVYTFSQYKTVWYEDVDNFGIDNIDGGSAFYANLIDGGSASYVDNIVYDGGDA